MGLRYAVTGSQGQLGRCLLRSLAPDALAAAWGHHDLDIADASVVEHIFDGCEGGPPDVLVNAAAYNAVDACEGSGAAEAEGVNAVGPGLLAEACERAGVRLIHVSTDYVFDGCGEHPYTEDGEPAPASAYGRSKRNGELRVLAASPGAMVVRTSWVYGPGRNFAGAILRQARLRRSGEASGPLSVVDDQTGCPTYAADLAEGICALACRAASDESLSGVHHLAGAGTATWFDFARAILDGGGFADIGIERGRTEELGLAAPRPRYSVLGCERAAAHGVALRPWREALRDYLASEDLDVTLALTDPGYWEDRERGPRADAGGVA